MMMINDIMWEKLHRFIFAHLSQLALFW